MFKIPILRFGKFKDRYKQTVTIDADLSAQVVESYDPNHFKAPLIISHDLPPGETDTSIGKHKELAFGSPSNLELIGDRVFAVFERISPKFVELWKNGEILAFSSSLYRPDSENNPYNTWSLRHIAALGVSPPAIKGLGEPVGLSEDNQSLDLVFELTDYDLAEGVSAPKVDSVDLSFPLDEFLTNMREQIIADKGIDAADEIVPKYMIQEGKYFFENHRNAINRLWEEIYTLQDKLESLSLSESNGVTDMPDVTTKTQQPTTDVEDGAMDTPTELSDNDTRTMPDPVISKAELEKLRNENSQLLERTIALEEAQDRRDAIDFCGTLKAPFVMEPVSLSSDDGSNKSMDIIDFMVSLTDVQTEFFKGLMKKMPALVDLDSEQANQLTAPKKSVSLSETDQRSKDIQIGTRAKEIRREAKASGQNITLSVAIARAKEEIEAPPVS